MRQGAAFKRTRAASLLGALAILALTASPAAAGTGSVGADQLAPYKLRFQTFSVAAGQLGGGYAACPANSRVMTGGAFWNDAAGAGPNPRDQVYISGSSATLQADGWYGAGRNATGEPRDLVVAVQCLPRSGPLVGTDDLAPYRLRFALITVPQFYFGGGYTSCPATSRVVTGGSFFNNAAGTGPDPLDRVILSGVSSTLQADGSYGAGLNFTDEARGLVVSAQCLPRNGPLVGAGDLAPYKLRFQTFSIQDGKFGGGYATCPNNARVVAGGAFWNNGAGTGPDPQDQVYISGSSATLQADGWYGAGRNGTDETRTLVVAAQCLPR